MKKNLFSSSCCCCCCCWETCLAVWKPKRRGYEKLPQQSQPLATRSVGSNHHHDDDDNRDDEEGCSSLLKEQQQQQQEWLAKQLSVVAMMIATILLLVVVVVVLTRRVVLPQQQQQQQQEEHHETIPTFLSVRDAQTGTLLYALDNPLYDTTIASTTSTSTSKQPAAAPWGWLLYHNHNNHNNNNEDTHGTRDNNNNHEEEERMMMIPNVKLVATTNPRGQQDVTLEWNNRMRLPCHGDNDDDDDDDDTNNNDNDKDDAVPQRTWFRQRRRRRRHDSIAVQPNDVWVLYCGSKVTTDNDDNKPNDASWLWQSTNVYEVATVAQVQATHQATCRDGYYNAHAAAANTTVNVQQASVACASSPPLSSSSSSSTTSSSSSFWYIPNFPTWHRQDVCQFVLYKRSLRHATKTNDDDDNWQVVAASPTLDMRHTSVTSPTQLHLALTQDPTELVIQFTSGQGTPIVAYYVAKTTTTTTTTTTSFNTTTTTTTTTNNDKNPKWIHVTGSTTTYQATDLCMAPANETGPGKFQSPGWLHTVVLTHLPRNATVVYKAGIQHGQGVTWSPDVTTHTALTTSQQQHQQQYDHEPWSYIVYADQGCPPGGWSVGQAFMAALVAHEWEAPVDNNNNKMRMIHHVGDLSYAQGAAHQWDAWLSMIEPASSRVPYHVAVGNHEYDYTAGGGAGKDPTGNVDGYHPVWGNFNNDSGGECGVPVSKRFRMPWSTGGVFWYAHNYANLHTIVLSAEHDLSPGSVQYEWLQHDLMSVNRTATPWIVVELHRPLYQAEMKWDQNNVGIALRMELETLLHDYAVDLVLAGHYHAYLRTCDGLYKGRCGHANAPTHITVGTAGAHLDEQDLYDNPWTVSYIKQTYGYGRITVVNATDLHFEFVQGATSENDPDAGQVLDDVWIHRER